MPAVPVMYLPGKDWCFPGLWTRFEDFEQVQETILEESGAFGILVKEHRETTSLVGTMYPLFLLQVIPPNDRNR
ncbi:hypothetical protein N7539_006568 [Penicillium diatomitis]|uniref:Uncharacterized protein n=1 Tax=Penicillium diatomitis TaxID=2819901 RepID=A0A9W9X1J6_9EURO|nr:uncharacterized protein N7539_006568 [Penicillium diatomitis]KAJ5480674.1 hypothetical protein N7539_006568 [Penicillium diatomitis]